MKKIAILLVLFLPSLLIFGQKYSVKSTIYPKKVWTFDGRTLPEGIDLLNEPATTGKSKEKMQESPHFELEYTVNAILNEKDYKTRFVLAMADVPDVLAVLDGEQPYILYAPTFETHLFGEEISYILLGKLAHEIAYHAVKGISFKSVKEQVFAADLYAAETVGKVVGFLPEVFFEGLPEYKIGSYPTKAERIKNLNEKAPYLYEVVAANEKVKIGLDSRKAREDSTRMADSVQKVQEIELQVARDAAQRAAEQDAQRAEGQANSFNLLDEISSLTPAFQQKAESYPKTEVQWLEEEYNFGTIKEGEVVSHRFNFKNIGQNELYVTHVKPSCGCTATEWSKDAIKPNESGYVDMKFDSQNKAGEVNKTITIYGNIETITKSLSFKGTITARPEEKPSKGKRKQK